MAFGVKAVMHEPLVTALERVRRALAENGLDVVTETNITAALQGYSAGAVPEPVQPSTVIAGSVSVVVPVLVARAVHVRVAPTVE